jgi:HPt (histidine-containing phosphotransfer) domain-containing protein
MILPDQSDTTQVKETETDEKPLVKNHIKKALWDIFDDDISATRSMIQHFIKQVPENVQHSRILLSQNQFEEACKGLHKVKPGFSYLGFPEVANQVENIQQQIRKNQDIEKVNRALQNLESEIKKIVLLLGEVLSELETQE